MMSEKRMVAVAIGVRAAQGLRYLPGALNCADHFFRWAEAAGYEARLVTDENDPVTVGRLRTEFDEILQDPRPIHRLLIYFAGHGLIRELESGLWLLSDSMREGRVVAYEALRQRFATYGVKQIAIFSDACRSLPTKVRHLQFDEHSVLAFGDAKGDPDVDKFLAAQDGEQAFAVPGSNPGDDICVFSGVLLEALWGTRPDAFSKLATDRITSSSLGKYLKDRVPDVAQTYGLTLKPSVSPAFPEDDNIYFTVGALAGAALPFVWPSLPGPPLPEGGPPPVRPDASGVPAEPTAVDSERRRGARVVRPRNTLLKRIREQKLPHGFETGSGFAVEGAEIRRLWTPKRVHAEPHGSASWWRVRDAAYLKEPAPILIEFADGRFAALAALPGLIAGLVCDARGVSAVVYRPVDSRRGARWTEDAIGRLESGALRADAVADLATQIRDEKHVDPMLGVFAAYLYDSIGDVASIRQMAYYYVKHRQPIPYDIALLADILSEPRGGRLVAYVPPVAERTPRSDAERDNPWTYRATPAGHGVVGGAWPWLRQGWVFLADPTNSEATLILPGLAGLARHLAPSRFTTFEQQGGLELARLFSLVPRDPP